MTPVRQTIGLVGLGMALGPHLASLRDLSGRAEIASAWTPSPQRRAAARDMGLPVVETLDAMLADPAWSRCCC